MGAITYPVMPAIIEKFDSSGASMEIGIDGRTVLHHPRVRAQQGGDTKRPMYATLISMVFIRIRSHSSLPGYIRITGVWLAVICGITLQTGMLFTMYRHGDWKSMVI